MNLQDYISSGILEAYVLGDLSPAEMKEVEENAVKYNEVKEEIAQLEEVFYQIAVSNAKEPLPGTREALFAKIDKLEGTKENPYLVSERKVVPLTPNDVERQEKGKVMWYWAAAAAFLAIFSSIAAINYYYKWQSSEEKYAVVVAENTRIAQNFDAVNRRFDQVQKDLAIISEAGFERVNLQGLPISPESKALIYWNRSSSEVYLDIASLPNPPSDKQYQLWAIVDGKPVDAGVFLPGEKDGLLQMKNIQNASAFAVTLEPKGGSESPTMDAMYVMGEV